MSGGLLRELAADIPCGSPPDAVDCNDGHAGGQPHQLPSEADMWVYVVLVFVPNVLIAAKQTKTIIEIITAYSTAVGPSSLRRKIRRN
jgi:hypothetical protein